MRRPAHPAFILPAVLLCMVAFATQPRAGQIEIAGVAFDRATTVGQQSLPLHGGGLLRYLGFRVYTCALYADPADIKAGRILDPVPKQLEFRYWRTLKDEDFIKSTREFIGKDPATDAETIKEGTDAICRIYRTVREGDRYQLRYDPERGTELLLNGKSLGVVEGEAFGRAMFGIWLSEYSLNRELRRKMLEGETD